MLCTNTWQNLSKMTQLTTFPYQINVTVLQFRNTDSILLPPTVQILYTFPIWLWNKQEKTYCFQYHLSTTHMDQSINYKNRYFIQMFLFQKLSLLVRINCSRALVKIEMNLHYVFFLLAPSTSRDHGFTSRVNLHIVIVFKFV